MKSPRLTIPGKVFLLGEYAVLDGGAAWVSAVSPRFEFAVNPGSSPFHPESPAGRFAAASPLSEGVWGDPWEGRGGFGGSTAEFAAMAYLSGVRDPIEAHSHYRSLFSGASKPSGADLVAQWMGGTIEWKPSGNSGSFRQLDQLSSLPIILFSATHIPARKTRTYSHLDSISKDEGRFESLMPILDLANSGLERQDLSTLGTAFTRYADALYELGLEAEIAHADRLALLERPGVLGAKGCGALQTDATVVVLESPKHAQDLAAFADEALGLRLLSFGLKAESGIREEGTV